LRNQGLSSQQIYEKATAEDEVDGPRDKKQVQNACFLMTNPKEHCGNAADEVQACMVEYYRGLSEGDAFIRHVRHTGLCPPSFLVYGDRVMQDIKNFCRAEAEHRSPLGMDRTFHLSRCYVTFMVYKQKNLLWTGGQKGSPVFLGPVYIHWKGNYENYFEMFAALKRDLFDQDLAGTQMDPTFLNFGSDQEKALLKALNAVFPECPKLLCVRHLMQNLVDHLKDKIGIPTKERREVADAVMKLRDVESEEEFDSKANRLQTELQGQYPSLGKYLSDFTDALKKYCVIPHLNGYHDSVDFTTNANESINFLAKLRTGWKPQRLMELVNMLKKWVEAQESDVRRALFASGNYQLAPHMKHLEVKKHKWTSWNAAEQKLHVDKFYKGAKKRPKTVKSRDGSCEIPDMPNNARKPGEKRRPRSSRTKSKPKK
jgi:hypothetical protein